MKDKKIIILSSVILGVLVLTLGVTFAIFTFNRTSSNSKLVVGDIYMHYNEANDGITLTNQMPFKEEYIVNPIMQTQSDTRNELMKCITIIMGLGMPLEDGTYESFCKGTEKNSNNETFQEAVDSLTWFTDVMIQQFKNENIITSDNKVNPIMQTQSDTRNELTKCIEIIEASRMPLADGSTYESFCKGTGKTFKNEIFQEAVDSGTWFPNVVIQQLKNNNIITSDNKVNPIMKSQSDAGNELEKCVNFCAGSLLEEGSTYESFCKGTGKIQNGETVMTFQEAYNNNLFADYDTQLKDDNIILFSTKTLPYFEFTIDGKNTYEKNDIWYDLVLSYGDQPDGKTTRIKDNLLKFRLTEITSGVETEIFNNKSFNDLTNKRIHVDTIPKNTLTEIKHTYRLYMWISSDTKICSGELTTGCDYYINGTTPNWSDVFASIKVGATGDFNEKITFNDIVKNKQTDTCKTYIEEDNVTYLSGSAECVNFNYVWYSGKLWRITAIDSDGAKKLITDNPITVISYGPDINFYDISKKDNSTYTGSYIYQWLNEDFLDTLYNHENIIVEDNTWNASSVDNLTDKISKTTLINNLTIGKNTPVGLLNTYEYYLSYKNIDDKSQGYLGDNIGYTLNIKYSEGTSAVRPVINLKSSIKFISGNGTKDNPYKIAGDKESVTPNTTYLNTRISGEYVIFDEDGNSSTNELYRIVGIEGGITKLNKIELLKENGTVLKKQSMIDYGRNVNIENESRWWDNYLNNDWYNSLANKDMLTAGTYYLKYSNLKSYKDPVCNTDSTIETIKKCTRTEEVWTGLVGIPMYGEMFASYNNDIDNTDIGMFILPGYSYNQTMYIWSGNSLQYNYSSYSYATRPSITLKSNVVITGGDGTKESPFTIALKN